MEPKWSRRISLWQAKNTTEINIENGRFKPQINRSLIKNSLNSFLIFISVLVVAVAERLNAMRCEGKGAELH